MRVKRGISSFGSNLERQSGVSKIRSVHLLHLTLYAFSCGLHYIRVRQVAEPGADEQIRHLRQSLSPLSLRLIHSGRLLTDGILLVPWLRSLEDRLRRQASTMGGDVESVLKEVGLAEDGDTTSTSRTGSGGSGVGDKGKGEERVWLHCIVGGKLDEKKPEAGDEEEVSHIPTINTATQRPVAT